VYSAHDYVDSFGGSPLATVLDQAWGSLLTGPEPVPVWVGEFGASHATTGSSFASGEQGRWFSDLISYLGGNRDFDWAYWPVNGTNSTASGRTPGEETYGLLDTAWRCAANVELLKQLQSIQNPTLGPGIVPGAVAAPQVVRCDDASGGGGGGTDYAAAVTADQPSLYLRMDERSGTTAHDASGHGHSGSYVGAVALGSPGIPGGGGDPAVALDGSGSVDTPTLDAIQGAHDRTIEMWFRTSQADDNLLSTGTGGTGHALDVALVGSQGPGGCGSVASPGVYIRFWDSDLHLAGLNLADGVWHYVAVAVSSAGTMVSIVVDDREPEGYVWDGVCYPSAPDRQPFVLPNPVNTAPAEIGIGSPGWTSALSGTVDEVAVYPTALDVTELQHHYFLGSAVS